MRVRLRPSKAVSILGVLAGGVMTYLGLVEVIPAGVGLFGYLWTSIAAIIGLYYAYNLLSKKGICLMEMELVDPPAKRKK